VVDEEHPDPDGSRLRVACIGLGKMGQGIAQNVVAAGFDTSVWNRTPAKTAPFVDSGARAAATPADAVEDADVVASCLFDDASVLEATTGPDGILRSMRADAVHVGTTTVSPACTRELVAAHASHGSAYAATHVLGRPDVAAAGELVIMAGGPTAAIERARPVLDAFGRAVLVVGEDPQQATHAKLIANYTLVATLELIGEVYAWTEKAGVDKAAVKGLLDLMLPGAAITAYNQRIFDRSFGDGGFALEGGLKDVGMMLGASGEVGAPLPIANVVRDRLVTAMNHGLGDVDWAALTEMTREAAGLE
jgi:3-hydroxyisobutyrate dehydrogenase-like beta-hydroxyacid dehydrogenase